MTAPRNPDDLIRAFLGEGESDLPDRAFDAVRADIHRTRQRVVIGPWREPKMSTFARVAIATVAVLAVGLVGREVLDSGPAAVTPSASPPSASPSIAPSPTLEPVLEWPDCNWAGRRHPANRRGHRRDRQAACRSHRRRFTEITWAPDGQRFALHDQRESPAQRRLGDEPSRMGRRWQIFTCGDGPDGCGIDWAPDGSRIAVTARTPGSN